MKRRNVQQAFIGESDPLPDGLGPLVEGDDVVDLEVTGGKIMLVVPPGTSEHDLFEQQRFVGGELVLEDGTVLTFTIHEGAIGAHVSRSRRGAAAHP